MFKGVLTALVTPFRDGELDEPALRELCERQIAAGVDGLVPCGSTGESATLSHAEHARAIEVVVAAARGRVPVLAGSGSNATREAIELTRHARDCGADGALLISPYYNKPMPHGIFAHYEAVARETGLPLVVYNIPGRTASNMEPPLLAQLAGIDGVVGVKEASGDLNQIAHSIAAASAVSADFAVLSGDDWATLPILALGGRGVICTTSNLAPGEMLALLRAWQSGDAARARAQHYRLLPLFDALFCETNPIPIKAALALCGLIQNELRPPLTALRAENLEPLREMLASFGLP